MLKDLSRRFPDRLVVDAGGWSERTNPDRPEARSRAHVEGMRELGLEIANVSSRDLRFGPELLQGLTDSLGVQLVSANIVVGGKAWFRPYVLMRRRVGSQEIGIAIAGVTAKSFGAEDAWPDSLAPEYLDPIETATALAGELGPRSDVQILLAYLPTSDLEALAERVPEWDLLVSGTGDLLEPVATGPAPVVLGPGTKCKFLGWAAIESRGDQGVFVTAAGIPALDAQVADDAPAAELVLRLKRRFAPLPTEAATTSPASGAAAPVH